jgi:hypothetical protein
MNPEVARALQAETRALAAEGRVVGVLAAIGLHRVLTSVLDGREG